MNKLLSFLMTVAIVIVIIFTLFIVKGYKQAELVSVSIDSHANMELIHKAEFNDNGTVYSDEYGMKYVVKSIDDYVAIKKSIEMQKPSNTIESIGYKYFFSDDGNKKYLEISTDFSGDDLNNKTINID